MQEGDYKKNIIACVGINKQQQFLSSNPHDHATASGVHRWLPQIANATVRYRGSCMKPVSSSLQIHYREQKDRSVRNSPLALVVGPELVQTHLLPCRTRRKLP